MTGNDYMHGMKLRRERAELEYIAGTPNETGFIGGWPPCLESLTAAQRETVLKEMGFHVCRRWENEGDRWICVTGGIAVDLDTGFVVLEKGNVSWKR